MDEVALEEGQVLGLGVIELDSLDHLGADLSHIAAHLVVEVFVIDQHAAVVTIELLAQHAHREVELTEQQAGATRFCGLGLDRPPALGELGNVSLEVFG